jgi:hypothetical protein
MGLRHLAPFVVLSVTGCSQYQLLDDPFNDFFSLFHNQDFAGINCVMDDEGDYCITFIGEVEPSGTIIRYVVISIEVETEEGLVKELIVSSKEKGALSSEYSDYMLAYFRSVPGKGIGFAAPYNAWESFSASKMQSIIEDPLNHQLAKEGSDIQDLMFAYGHMVVTALKSKTYRLLHILRNPTKYGEKSIEYGGR